MVLAVPAHLGFCVSPSGAMFLDTRRGRYFGLPPDLEAAFSTLVASSFDRLDDEAAVRRLKALGVLEEVLEPQDRCWPPAARISLRDGAAVAEVAGSCSDIAAVAAAVLRARARLRRAPLAKIIAGLPKAARPHDRGELQDLVRRYQQARRWTPIRPVCLLDSMAMLDFLAARGHRPALVFGVTRQPFKAHCWLQDDAVVLNDPLDHVVGYSPVLAV